jgi:trimeric autotransporter adhesin
MLTGWQIVNKFFTPKKLRTTLIKVDLAFEKTKLKAFMRKLFTIKFLLPLLFLGVSGMKIFGQVSIPAAGVPVTQDFNTLAISGTTNTWTDNTTIAGWYSNRVVYLADAGTSATGGLYSYGTAATSERALGGLSSGSASPIFGVRLVNNTGGTISGLTISFRGEQWRQTANVQALVFESQVGATALTTGTWVANTAFNFTALKTGTAGALDGNAAGNFSVINGTLTATVANGQEIWLRWSKTGTTSPGLSIDDISITANAAISSNADLSNLTLSAGTLSPVFSPATTSYTASVANTVTSITLTPTAVDVNSTITVNGNAVTSGSPSGSIVLAVGPNVITTVVTAQDAVTTKTYTVTVTRAAAGVATVSITTSLPDFGAVCINTTTTASSFKITGTDLNGSNIGLAALPGFTYSETAGGTYTNTLSFSYTAPGFTDKEIFVKFNPTIVQSYNGNIILSGGGLAANVTIPVTGSGVNTLLTITTGGSSLVTATSGTAAGIINVTGCAAITTYGIEYSTTSGFVDGTGTKVAASNLVGGNFSSNLTGLSPNTRYYYKAYAGNGTVTGYGTQQAFTCTPLPVAMASQPLLSYTEDFADIANWSNFFITGVGANHFSGLSATGTGGIPNGTTLTASTLSFQSGTPGTSGGVQKGTDQAPPIPITQSIILLSTGSPDNTTSSAIDLYLDFTGVDAGNLNFDYQTFSNSLATGANDRSGSLRVYASTDGITFTELTSAAVLNFINNSPISGSKINIALPASFNRSATARLRFYYSNGNGGTSGSRPKVSIDNLNVTARATVPCVRPTAPATALTFSNITDVSIKGSFTAASPAADEYLVIMSNNSSLTGNPADLQNYLIGDNVGDGTVIARGNINSFTATGLSPLTRYYFFIFPLNSVCIGSPLYYTTTILNGTTSTIAGLPACAAPATQPGNLVLSSTSINSVQGSFTATAADEYLIIRSTFSVLNTLPANTQAYNNGDIVGNGVVVQKSNSTLINAIGLQPGTQYYFFIFSLNSTSCINGPVYNTTTPLNGTATTKPLPPCSVPANQPVSLLLTAASTAVSGTFVGISGADDYLVIRSNSPVLTALPANNTDYPVGSTLGGGTIISNSANTSFIANGLTPNTTYYFFVFAANKSCSGGTKYLTASPLTESIVTAIAITKNYYFGTLHSHSDYSDGNKDQPGYTPADNYNYAMTAQCMDYLGISEHNHFSSIDNPGNSIANYRLGITQANTFTATHPNFLALYGMEWGVISGGGHVVVYGDGMDKLWGWETGSGVWGPSNNYDVYVPKSVYTGSTGLFKTVNDNIASNTFATLAHPNLTDYNNIAGIPYDALADNAVAGISVESGPATSTNTTYTNPASSLFYLWYFQTLLAKGYHLGPTIDHDNHNTTFGKTSYSRTAIIAPALTKTALISAMRNMNFYATQDCDSKVDFTINTKIMGSTVIDRFEPNISATLTDATTSTSSAVIRVMFGVPGSGIPAVKIDSVIGNTLNIRDNNLPNLATGYYYLDIVNGNSRIITSPIWYTRYDAVFQAAKLGAFTAQKTDRTSKLNWSTEKETNSTNFTVERSVDGINWNSIGTVSAAGNSNTRLDYGFTDNAPVTGYNYYRIKLTEADGKFYYTYIRSTFFYATAASAYVAPNPAKGFINIYLIKTGNHQALFQLSNSEGKIVYTNSSAQNQVQISTAGMSKGLYFIKVIDADKVSILKVLVQ